jgi:hypothetical protein
MGGTFIAPRKRNGAIDSRPDLQVATQLGGVADGLRVVLRMGHLQIPN